MLPKSRRALTIQEIAALARSSLHGNCPPGLGRGGVWGGIWGRGEVFSGTGGWGSWGGHWGHPSGVGGHPGVPKGTSGAPKDTSEVAGGTQEASVEVSGAEGWG